MLNTYQSVLQCDCVFMYTYSIGYVCVITDHGLEIEIEQHASSQVQLYCHTVHLTIKLDLT